MEPLLALVLGPMIGSMPSIAEVTLRAHKPGTGWEGFGTLGLFAAQAGLAAVLAMLVFRQPDGWRPAVEAIVAFAQRLAEGRRRAGRRHRTTAPVRVGDHELDVRSDVVLFGLATPLAFALIVAGSKTIGQVSAFNTGDSSMEKVLPILTSGALVIFGARLWVKTTLDIVLRSRSMSVGFDGVSVTGGIVPWRRRFIPYSDVACTEAEWTNSDWTIPGPGSQSRLRVFLASMDVITIYARSDLSPAATAIRQAMLADRSRTQERVAAAALGLPPRFCVVGESPCEPSRLGGPYRTGAGLAYRVLDVLEDGTADVRKRITAGECLLETGDAAVRLHVEQVAESTASVELQRSLFARLGNAHQAAFTPAHAAPAKA